MGSPESIHSGNILQSNKVILIHTYIYHIYTLIYIDIYVAVFNLKRSHDFEKE